MSEKLFNNALLPNDFINKTGIDEFQFRSGTAWSTSQYWILHWKMAGFVKSPEKSLIRWRIMVLATIFKAGWKYHFQKANFSTKIVPGLLYYWFHQKLTIQCTGLWSKKLPTVILTENSSRVSQPFKETWYSNVVTGHQLWNASAAKDLMK